MKNHWAFLLILMIACNLYGAILATSQSHVDGDEAVIGMMARHIVDRGERPIFLYGQAYGGGCAIEAYLATIPFALFGASSIPLKLVALAISLATLIVTYLFCISFWDKRMALVTASILAVASPLVEWHTKMRGGYAAMMLLSVVALWVFMAISRKDTARGIWFFFFGTIIGFGLYNKELMLPIILAIILSSGIRRDLFWKPKSAALLLLGGVLGAAPLVYYNLANNFENVRYLFSIGSGDGEGRHAGLVPVLFQFLPKFFHPRNVDGYIDVMPLRSWIEYALFAVLAAVSALACRSAFVEMAKGWLPGRRKSDKRRTVAPEAVLLLTAAIILVMCAMSYETVQTPRYFVALFPGLAILAGGAITRMWGMTSRGRKVLAATSLAIIIAIGTVSHASYIRPPMVSDDVALPDGRIVVRRTSPKILDEIIEFVDQEGVSHVYATYFLQWRIIFESGERIIASSVGMHPGRVRYPEYDEQVAAAERVGIVFHRDSAAFLEFKRTAWTSRMKRRDFEDYAVFIDVR